MKIKKNRDKVILIYCAGASAIGFYRVGKYKTFGGGVVGRVQKSPYAPEVFGEKHSSLIFCDHIVQQKSRGIGWGGRFETVLGENDYLLQPADWIKFSYQIWRFGAVSLEAWRKWEEGGEEKKDLE